MEQGGPQVRERSSSGARSAWLRPTPTINFAPKSDLVSLTHADWCHRGLSWLPVLVGSRRCRPPVQSSECAMAYLAAGHTRLMPCTHVDWLYAKPRTAGTTNGTTKAPRWTPATTATFVGRRRRMLPGPTRSG